MNGRMEYTSIFFSIIGIWMSLKQVETTILVNLFVRIVIKLESYHSDVNYHMTLNTMKYVPSMNVHVNLLDL